MAMPKINQSPSSSSSPVSRANGPGDAPMAVGGPASGQSGSTSAMVYTPAGSGSRPVSSRFPIPTSAPVNPRTRGTGQAPAGWLK